jgi:hypothetical protein
MKKWFVLSLAGVLLGMVGAGPAVAQSREDSAAVWLDAARQLRESGQPGAAEALLELLLRRFAGTVAAGDAARQLELVQAQPEPERPGRVELLVFSTTYGLWLGVALPVIGKADQPEIYGLGIMLGAPTGFLAAHEYLKGHPLTEGQARAITFGGSWGSWQGFGWTEVLDPGAAQYCDGLGCTGDTSPSAEALVAGTVLGGLAGIVTGAVMARRPITPGVATAVSFGGLWGTWYGGVLGVLLDLEGDDLLAATLVGGDAGLLAMGLLAPRWKVSRNQARLVNLGGLVGLLAGLGLDLIFQPDGRKAAMLIPAATSTAGLLVAAASVRPAADRGSGGAGSPPSGGGSLLEYRAGQWQAGMPVPGLKLEREREGTRAALYLPVLQASF